jgi:hypothetical protein
MPQKGEDGDGSPVSINIGKEIDAALGEIIRGLLRRPAEESGNLIADGIGILGDRVRRKRERNAYLGIEEVRSKLQTQGVEIEDVTPPEEEELFLLMNGLSLANDQNLRNMWAGLFAKALEPNSGVSVERPFISVLDSLSPMDAKMIDFLSFAEKTQTALAESRETFQPKNYNEITEEEKRRLQSVNQANTQRAEEANHAIAERAVEYGILELTDSAWADNLKRQGLIESTRTKGNSYPKLLQISSLSEREIYRAFAHFKKEIADLREASVASSAFPGRPLSSRSSKAMLHFEVRLSKFGRRLAVACGLL